MEADGLQTRKSRLELNARPAYFPGGRMTVRCESNQFQLYKKFSVMELTDDSPRLAQMISPTTVLSAGKRGRFVSLYARVTRLMLPYTTQIPCNRSLHSTDGQFVGRV